MFKKIWNSARPVDREHQPIVTDHDGIAMESRSNTRNFSMNGNQWTGMFQAFCQQMHQQPLDGTTEFSLISGRNIQPILMELKEKL